MFTRIMKARSITIDATVLFVDLRVASQVLDSVGMIPILDAFYDECAGAIWDPLSAERSPLTVAASNGGGGDHFFLRRLECTQ
jgi:hypothetical protein